MIKPSQIIFFVFLAAIFILEGTGFPNGRETAYFLVLSMPFFLYFLDIIKGKAFSLPKRMAILFFLLSLFLTISTLLSTNIFTSFKMLLFYLAVFLIFFYVFNHQSELIKAIEPVLISLGVFFSIYSVLAIKFNLIFPGVYQNFTHVDEYVHNSLGDFLGAVLIILLTRWLNRKKNLYLYLLFSLFYFFIFSFSRTAYISFFIVSSIILLKNIRRITKKMLAISGAFLIIAFSFFFLTTKEAKNIIQLNWFYNLLQKNYSYSDKMFVSNRDQYFLWGIIAIKDRPITGVGPGNFLNAAMKYTQIPPNLSASSKNIILDFFAEGGIFVGIIFLLMLIYSYQKIGFQPVLFYLFLAFSTYNFYQYYSALLLFFILLGIYFKEKTKVDVSLRKLILLPLIILLAIFPMMINKVLSSQLRYEEAFRWYALDEGTVVNLTNRELYQGNIKNGTRHLNWLLTMAPGTAYILEMAGDWYLALGEKDKALALWQMSYQQGPYRLKTDGRRRPAGRKLLVRDIYELEKELHGKKEADKFFDSFIKKLQMVDRKRTDALIFDEAKIMCNAIYDKCPYKL